MYTTDDEQVDESQGPGPQNTGGEETASGSTKEPVEQKSTGQIAEEKDQEKDKDQEGNVAEKDEAPDKNLTEDKQAPADKKADGFG